MFRKSIVCSLFITSYCLAALMSVKQIDPTIVIELHYARTSNFTKQVIYDHEAAFVHEDVAQALKSIQHELKQKGLGLKVWDAYRPLAAQWKLWHVVPDPRYVSDPRKGGRHTRGTAVDVTIIELSSGEELDMGTDFDNFTPQAWSTCTDLPQSVLDNRKLLTDIMQKRGFKVLKWE